MSLTQWHKSVERAFMRARLFMVIREVANHLGLATPEARDLARSVLTDGDADLDLDGAVDRDDQGEGRAWR
jgi:hypothetical protein